MTRGRTPGYVAASAALLAADARGDRAGASRARREPVALSTSRARRKVWSSGPGVGRADRCGRRGIRGRACARHPQCRQQCASDGRAMDRLERLAVSAGLAEGALRDAARRRPRLWPRPKRSRSAWTRCSTPSPADVQALGRDADVSEVARRAGAPRPGEHRRRRRRVAGDGGDPEHADATQSAVPRRFGLRSSLEPDGSSRQP